MKEQNNKKEVRKGDEKSIFSLLKIYVTRLFHSNRIVQSETGAMEYWRHLCTLFYGYWFVQFLPFYFLSFDVMRKMGKSFENAYMQFATGMLNRGHSHFTQSVKYTLTHKQTRTFTEIYHLWPRKKSVEGYCSWKTVIEIHLWILNETL